MKKYFIFADVHGCFSALLVALDNAGFDPENKEHILLSLGDNFDRGKENSNVADFLIKYHKQERLLGILGNHDEFFLQFLLELNDGIFNCQQNGMIETLDSLAGLDASKFLWEHPEVIIAKIKENYPELISMMADEWENEFVIGMYSFTHAGYTDINYLNEKWEPDNWAKTEKFVMYYEKQDLNYVFGHWHAYRLHRVFGTSGKNDMVHTPFIYKNFIGIDPCSNLSQIVNVLVLENNILTFNGEVIPDGRKSKTI